MISTSFIIFILASVRLLDWSLLNILTNAFLDNRSSKAWVINYQQLPSNVDFSINIKHYLCVRRRLSVFLLNYKWSLVTALVNKYYWTCCCSQSQQALREEKKSSTLVTLVLALLYIIRNKQIRKKCQRCHYHKNWSDKTISISSLTSPNIYLITHCYRTIKEYM